MHPAFSGMLARLAATVPMTIVMESLHKQLPRSQRYPLPPREVTASAADAAGVLSRMNRRQLVAATTVSHFGYGAATGAIYGGFARQYMPGPAGGVAFGLAVWAGSYLGWLPAAGLFRGADREPARRNALMIAAHVVWGLALSASIDCTEKGTEDDQPQGT